MTAQHDWTGSSPQPSPIPQSNSSYGGAPQEPVTSSTGASKGSGEEGDIHTYLYYPAFAVAIILGGILALVLYVWISNNTSAGRIPIWLLALPAVLLVAAVRLGDTHVARAFPNLVPAAKRAAAAASGADQTSAAAGAAPQHPYGQGGAHAPAASYGLAGRQAGQAAPGTAGGYGHPVQAAQEGRSGESGRSPYGSLPNPPAGYGRPAPQHPTHGQPQVPGQQI